MNKIVRLFLVYVLGVLGVFSTYNVAEAQSVNFRGSADRIRSYTDFDYKFYKNGNKYYNSGFQCTPGEIRSDYGNIIKNNNESVATKIGQFIIEFGFTAGDALLTPLVCGVVIRSYIKNGVTSGIIATGIAGVFGEAINGFFEKYIVETDYGVDINNPQCLPVILPLIPACLTAAAATSFKVNQTVAWAIYIRAILISVAIREIYSGVKLDDAQDLFNYTRVCGDRWYTYGNGDLQEKILNESGSYVSDKGEISHEYIRQFYPVKGAFAGSYKYYLDRCITLRDADSCKKLDFTLDDKTQFSEKNKIYREYKYGGMEYSYSACNDPRPEAKSYDVNLGKTDLPQLYYSTGSDGINFACDRFLEKKEWYDDYKCCVNASKRMLCLEYNKGNNDNPVHTFCDKNSDCYLQINTRKVSSEKVKKLLNEGNYSCETFSNEEIKNKLCNVYKEDGKTKNPDYNGDACRELVDECNKVSTQTSYSGKYSDQMANNAVKLKITESSENPNKYCFTTQSLCPYDFNILGGTEKKGTEFNDSNECKINEVTEVYECEPIANKNCQGNYSDCRNQSSNFCQLDRHCMMLRPYPDVEVATPLYPYLDKSCLNNVGSSHNHEQFAAYNSYTRKINIKTHLTAPVVECIVETSKNLLFNKAGFTACKDESETPSDNEICESGYRFKKGEDVTQYGYTNFIEKTRGRLSGLVKILLVLAVTMYGFNLVVIGKRFKQEDFVVFFVKIIFVIALSLSTGWMKTVLDGTYKVSGAIINFTYRTLQIDDWKPDYNNPKFDGCYFSYSSDFNNNFDSYPSGRKYIAFFDYIDCKFQKYMGFDAGSIDIINVIILFVFTGFLTLVLVLPLLMIFLILLSVVVKIAYVFVVAMLTLTILLFLTPIMMPLSLFEKTKKIFEAWYKKILGYIFYPIFLIVAVTVLFFIYDKFFISEAIYLGENNAPYRTIYCGRVCKIENEYITIQSAVSDSDAQENCEVERGGEFIDLMEYPICIYKANGKVSDRSVDFVSFFVGLRFPILTISTSLYKFLFANYAILFIILLFIEMTLDGIIELGSVIFGASADGSEANKLRFANVMGKIYGWAMTNSSRAINTITTQGKRARMHRHKDENAGSVGINPENEQK